MTTKRKKKATRSLCISFKVEPDIAEQFEEFVAKKWKDNKSSSLCRMVKAVLKGNLLDPATGMEKTPEDFTRMMAVRLVNEKGISR